MCVIIHLPPNAMIDKDHFFNAVHNNHHSWGVVLVDGNNKTQLLRHCPDSGQYDPEVIWKTLEANLDIDRYVHLRNTTKGATNLDNTQPFQIYNSDKRQVFFFHNGTLTSYGSTSYNYHNAPKDGISDTREFCEKILIPAMPRWHGENGVADYLDPFFDAVVMDKQWSGNSKGMFVSNDLKPKFYGLGWTNYNKDRPELPVIMVSNTDYFERVTRGPAYKSHTYKAPEVAGHNTPFQHSLNKNSGTTGTASSTTTGKSTGKNASVSNLQITPIVESAFTVSKIVLHKIFSFFDRLPKDNSKEEVCDLTALAEVAYEEWVVFTEESDQYTIGAMLHFMGLQCAGQYEKAKILEEKLEKAQKHIESLVKEQKHAA